VRIGPSRALGQDVLHADRGHDRAYGTTGNDACAFRRRLQEHDVRTEPASTCEGWWFPKVHVDQVLLGRFDTLADRLRYFLGLAEPKPTTPAEGSPTTTRAAKDKFLPPFTTLVTD